MDASLISQMKAMEDENRRLKRMYADLSMQAAQSVLDRILALSDDAQGTSELLARLVTTFEGLGLFGDGRQILLPLFLAISLELGALFGPALLLRRRT